MALRVEAKGLTISFIYSEEGGGGGSGETCDCQKIYTQDDEPEELENGDYWFDILTNIQY